MAIDLGSAYGRIVIDVDQMKRSLNSAAGVMGRVNTASVLMGNLLTQGVEAAGRALAGLAANTVGAGADMEQQVANIAAVMGRTQDEIGPLQELIQNLAINPNLKVNAVEAGAAIEMLARNGLALDEIMSGAAESTVLLANATGGEFGDAADIMTDAMSLFGIEATATMDAVNGITSVVTNSKFTINDYALALAQGGGVASTVGVEFDDFNTTIAAISPLFKSGSDAGTSFKTFLQRLVPSSSAAEDAMAELGLITEENQNLFFDYEGNLLSMANISTVLANATADLSEEERNMALSTIFGSDAMRAAAGVIDAGGQSMMTAAEMAERLGISIDEANAMIEDGVTNFDVLKVSMGNTDALESAETRMNTLSGATEVLDGLIEGFGLQMGTAMLPAVRSAVDALSQLAEDVGPVVVAFFEDIAFALSGATEVFIKTKDPISALEELLDNFLTEDQLQALFDFNNALRETLANLEETLAPVLTFIENNVILNDVLIALGLTLAAAIIPSLISAAVAIGTIMIPFLALIALVAALRIAWENNFLGIRDKTEAAWAVIQPVLQTVWAWLSENIPIALQAMRDQYVNAFNQSRDVVTAVWGVISGIWQSIVSFINDSLIPTVVLIGERWSEIWSTISTVSSNVWTIISTIFAEIVRWINDNIVPILLFFWTQWVNTFNLIKEAISEWWTENVEPILAAIADWFEFKLTSALEVYQEAGEAVWEAIQEAIEVVWEVIEPIFNALQVWFEQTLTAALDVIDEKWNTVFDGIKVAINAVKQTIDNLKESAQKFWDWISSHTFSFNFSIPDIPDWLIPGSPTPLEIAWRSLEGFTRGMRLEPRASVAGDALAAGVPGGLGLAAQSAAAAQAGQASAQGDTYYMIDAREAQDPESVQRAVERALRQLGIKAKLVSFTR